MSDLTRQERIDRVQTKIKELGILDICDVNSLEGFESAIDIVEEHQKKYPEEFIAMENDFIIKHRDEVWKCDRVIQHLYFHLLHKVSFQLKEAGIEYDKISCFLEKTFNGQDFRKEHDFAKKLDRF